MDPEARNKEEKPEEAADQFQTKLETRSRVSATSRTSAKSDIVKARLTFAEKEARLKVHEAALKEEEAVILARLARQRAEIQAELCLERKVLEQLEEDASDSHSLKSGSVVSSVQFPPMQTEEPEDITKKYVESVCSMKDEDLHTGHAIGKFLLKRRCQFKD